jgi:hypothetical protein
MGKILFPEYFPICPTDGSDAVVPGYTAALTATLAQTMKLFWRPRKIKVSGSYSQFNGNTRQCDVDANFELIIKSPYDSEEEMVCAPIKPWAVESYTNVSDPDYAFSWDSRPYYYGDPINSFFTFNGFDFALDRGPSEYGRCNSGVIIQQLYTVEGAPYASPFSWKIINICGVDYNMATYIDEYGIGYIQPSVEVTEWWSFGGTYDTATGEPL